MPDSASAVLDRLSTGGGAESPTATTTSPSNADGKATPTEETTSASQSEQTPAETGQENTTPGSESSTTTTADGTQAAEGTESTETAESIEPPSEPSLEESPEGANFGKFKPLFKENPGLREVVARHDALTELFPKFSEARQLREWFPTMEDAETIVGQAESLRTHGELFRSDPAAYMESLRESDSTAYGKLIHSIPDVLAQTDREQYARFAQTFTNNVLENAFHIAQQSGDKDALATVQNFASMMGYRLGTGTQSSRPDPRDAEIERLRSRDRDREQQDRDSQYTQFESTVNTTANESILSEIETVVTRLYKDAPESALKRIVPEIFSKVIAQMGKQPQTQATIQRHRDAAKTKGKIGQSDRDALVTFIVSRAKTSIPLVAKDVIGEWSKLITTSNSKKLNEKKDIAARTKDGGNGPQSAAGSNGNGNTQTQSGAPRTAATSRPKTVTSGDVLDRIESGQYTPPASNPINY